MQMNKFPAWPEPIIEPVAPPEDRSTPAPQSAGKGIRRGGAPQPSTIHVEPSTPMIRVTSSVATDNGERRCVRCTKPFFCRMDVVDEDQEEVMRIRMVGQQR